MLPLDNARGRQADVRQRRVPRLELAVMPDKTRRDEARVRPAQPHDTNAAASRRRRDGDDGICSGEAHSGWRLVTSGWCCQSPVTSHSHYFRNEMSTVFENASPTLSVVTPAISATARCTIRRS